MKVKKESPAWRLGLYQTKTLERKDKETHAQKQIIYNFFCSHHSTMYHAAQATGITRPNVCRYTRQLEDDGLIVRTKKGICPISLEAGVWYFARKGGVK